ncbi:hypothetical protein PR202_ga20658 [Eleusine coracana subsp. coracana]|uniref:Uncharacterized protein n=1 Tax=Eleusine coracana subsp. coracana TaxID=191504 RepID=A0AAV5CYH6_ELECO|nr:hypothetical protein PR202_ga20658 [Eleusine coracana subsp. coracana]
MAGDDDLVALTYSQKLDRLMLCAKLQTQITAMSRQLPPLPSMLPPVDSSSTKLQPPPKLSVIEVPTTHVCLVVEASEVKIMSAPSHMDNHHEEVNEALSVEMPSAAAPHPQAPVMVVSPTFLPTIASLASPIIKPELIRSKAASLRPGPRHNCHRGGAQCWLRRREGALGGVGPHADQKGGAAPSHPRHLRRSATAAHYARVPGYAPMFFTSSIASAFFMP